MKNNGFTLIELMITLAIVGILAAIAFPSFQESIRAAKRSDGIAAVLSLQLAQEKFRGSCPKYASMFGNNNSCNELSIEHGQVSSEGHYQLSLSQVTGNAYVITATPQGTLSADKECNPMTLTVNAVNPNGLKQPESCW
ncbi:pilus assembly protein [Colwellia sp. 75C3]|uniref:type IV pilin protein n=1 Tax=Colwellia sp. 75C3 TaxID=888425 RepID=UPI000C338688|nr:type IV pilin protein [Colwellia sp. 75C3]PKG82250.1 pilus assembly protein [Colwellia sp. 75C3]